MFTKIVLILCSMLTGSVNSASTYDQRQNGELNIQVDLKDLQIIALLKNNKEEYVDYDYAYDYSEMTIKPQNGTTSKPLNISSTAASTDIGSDNATVTTTIAFDQTTVLPVQYNSQVAETVTSTTTMKTTEAAITETPVAVESTTKNPNNQSTTAVNIVCRKGFVVNVKGECELKLQSSGNALLKLVKLSQKLKQRRENRNNSPA